MKSFSFPGGRAYLTVRSSRPDPASRYGIDLSDDAYTSAEGLVELGKFLIDAGKEAIKDEKANAAPDASADVAEAIEQQEAAVAAVTTLADIARRPLA